MIVSLVYIFWGIVLFAFYPSEVKLFGSVVIIGLIIAYFQFDLYQLCRWIRCKFR